MEFIRTVKGSSAAIYIKGSCNPIINNCTLIGTGNSSSNAYAAVVYSAGNSSGKINNCLLISENGSSVKYGHYNTGTATPAYNYTADGLNIINSQYFTTSGSNIYVTGGYPYFDYGSNTIADDNLSAQYKNSTGSSRNARYNYWEGTPSTSGTVVTSPIRSTAHPYVGPSKIVSDKLSSEDEYLAKAWKNYFDNNFTEAKEIAKEQFENNSKEEISTELLFLWMKSAMREGTLEAEETNLQTINKNTSINETSRYEAVRWLSKLAIREGDFETAESYIASVPSNSLMGREIIFDSADEIMENWGDLEKATALLDEVTTKYSDDETQRQKEFILNLYNSKKDSYKGSNKKETSEEEATVSSFALNPAYPNPFNPTTTISYQIPEQGFVTLKVYDMLGREVASLVNNKMAAGKYSVNFNANNLASGIYVYRITVQSFEGSKNFFTQSNKMLLLK